jgi:aldose 1-epimerase
MRKTLMPCLLAGAALAWCSAADAAEVRSAPYGVTKDGKTVTAYTLVNDKGASATVLDYGGTVTAVRVPDRDGKLGNVVMSYQNLGMWETVGHANAITGRYANVIIGGFDLDGVHYKLNPGANGSTMHGGIDQYSRRIWAVNPVRKADGAAVTLTLDSPDGDQGFPGRLKVAVKYSFTNNNELRLDFSATTDKATVLNLTNHIYFNLSGNGVPASDQIFQIMTDQIAGKNPGTLADSIIGTPFDFTKPLPLRAHLVGADPAYDDPAKAPPIPAGMTRGYNAPYLSHPGDNRLDRVGARLSDPATGRILEVRTTEISVHTFVPGLPREGLLTDEGKPFTRVPAIAFETQHLPNSPNRPEFPTTVLRPGQTFQSTTIFAFRTEPKR